MTKLELLSWSTALVLISFAGIPCQGGPQQEIQRAEAPLEQPLDIRFDNGRLTARLRNARLLAVSERLHAVTAINVIVDERLEDAALVKDVNNIVLEQALRELLSDYDTFFFYGSSKQSASALRTVWIYPKGSAAALKPFSPAVWASGAELETASRNSDPEVREKAYEALMTRPDQRSKNLLIGALRGITERDAGVRERLLSSAISNGFAIPDQVFIDLARTDQSDQIRLMALDALSEHPSAKQVAEAATADPSEAVRFRAKEILQEIGTRKEKSTGPEGPPEGPND